ncbi:LamG-like jellyroll fold domain-containing protein [Olleya aquimaris]|uniref:Putative secreted protein (Por secretion system target) n=1 Tax=Olleya aquimaris TaxID=639310 RepID=A0A327RE39_9FLAO|nr:LamG-like jellyroll fold domain-containing protein [Olleya aquimaris]RAJ12147.1 putative secreted protein (Por secretion system target) [Olleya aquimaris]
MNTKLLVVLTTLLAFNVALSQNSDVQLTVKWPTNSYQNKIEVYNTTNDLLVTICDDNQCYTGTNDGVTDAYGAKYDLGCVANGNNYYLKLYQVEDNSWDSGYVSVTVAGTEVINDDGNNASNTGYNIYFNVSGGDATCNSLIDTDNDGIIDNLDYDDDNDGIVDYIEALDEDVFSCTIPELDFENGVYDAAASTGSDKQVGAVYRFSNAIQGYDILLEILALDNTTISNIDNDTIDNPTYLQTELTFSGTGTPGAEFKFTIVNSGTTTASSEFFRINGTTWDCDGGGSLRESLIFHNPAAYGTENPTSLITEDLGGGDIQISASGLQEGPGFSNLKVLKSYYQFIGNSFSLRMQAIKTSTSTSTRQFGLSFSQCEFLDFNANSLIIVTGKDRDNDGKYNHLDLDSDNDGIPDNVEAQSTLGYVIPTGNINGDTGVDIAYHVSNGIDVVDTDGDRIPDYLDFDSDKDGKLDIEENGMVNTIGVFTDTDNDGLDNVFEGSNTSDPLDVNDQIDNPSASVLPDTDGDLFSEGDLDYRDTIDTFIASATLDFDGIDDYVVGTETFAGINQSNTDGATFMAWIKSNSDASDTNQKFVIGEKNAIEITLTGENINARIHYVKSNNTTATKSVYRSTTGIIRNVWRHVTVSVSFTENKAYLLLDGDFVFSTNLIDAVAFRSSITSEVDNLRMGNDQSLMASKFFKGSIDEVRIFNKFLPEKEVKEIVFQEIQNNAGQVEGTILKNQLTNVNWSNLEVYYPLTNVTTGVIKDQSSNSHDAEMFNITTIQEQSAPMPFVTKQAGNWHDKNTWLHGDVWYIPGDEVTQAATFGNDEVVTWGIYQIKHSVNLTTSLSEPNAPGYHKGLLALGVVVDEKDSSNNDVVFTIGNSSKDLQLNVSKYLEINGTINLKRDSQLIQGIESDLVTSEKGKIQRGQEGLSSVYRYNYWSSPVGAQATTNLNNDNLSVNNPNNTPFTINMLKDNACNDVLFTNAYHEDGKISKVWLYGFENGVTYYDWDVLGTSTSIEAGKGYTQKGGGSLSEYTFEGKPNNGTVHLSAQDVGGLGSISGISRTEYLVGNPYASAIDAHQFIDDNAGVIGGAIYLWEQWAGDSHNLNAYEGGYATLNKLGKVRAYQFIGIDGLNVGLQSGQKTPKQYLPVGQGFIVEVIGTGNIEFNNAQRVFKTETAGQSIFFRNSNQQESANSVQTDSTGIQKIKLEFKTNSDLGRELVLGFSDTTSDAFDYGYDALANETFVNDLTMTLDTKPMVIQAFDQITIDKVVDLNFKADGIATYSIKASEILNITDDQAVYLLDNLTGNYHDLKSGLEYNFTSLVGEFNNRFDVVFQNPETLSNEEFDLDSENTVIYFNNAQELLYVKGLDQETKAIKLYNAIGQEVFKSASITKNHLENGLQISNLSTGMYIVSIKTLNNQTLEKKIIIE